MIKKILFILLLILAIVSVVCFFVFLRRNSDVKERNKSETANYHNFHYAASNNKEFYGNLEEIQADKDIREKIYGGIVSHHLFASQEISRFFANLGKKNPETIVILGPNHFELNPNILISKYPYHTPWGDIYPDDQRIQEILKNNLVENNERSFETEHSISSLVGFIKYAFPDAKLIPIIFGKNTPRNKLELLADELNRILPDNSLVLASVDFSHHLNKIAARFHDQKSISSIQDFNFDNIFNLEIDSPPSIYALLRYLEKRGGQKMIYSNANSADLSKDYSSEDVTSYLFAYFTAGPVFQNENISILNFGDAMFDRDVERVISEGKNPFEYIKGAEGNFLNGADFIILNLEGPITDKNECFKKEISFRFSPQIADLLSESNINLVNMANNHIFDCGQEGIQDTRDYLDNFGIGYFGGRILENSYLIKEINGKKIAFVGIDQTIEPIKLSSFYSLIGELKNNNDYVVVNIHWGYEYNKSPSKIQKEIGHLLIDNGADVVIGHHPHIIQSVEIYKNRAIFYSLGNFIFDQTTKETNEGVGVGIVLEEDKYTFYIFPYKIINRQPILLSTDKMIDFCENFLESINAEVKDICSFTQEM